MQRLLKRWHRIDFLDLHALNWLDIFIFATLSGLALQWRLCQYLWKGIWLDESFTLLTALMDDPLLTICYRNMDKNPALYEFLLHFLVRNISYELDIARLPSVIFSTLTVYFMYRIFRDFEGRAAGIAAALLYAYQNYSVTYSHEVRAYALLGLFTSMAIWGFLRWIESPHERRFLVATLIGTLGAAYTHNFGLWVFIMQILFGLVIPSVRENLRPHYWLYMGLFLLAYAPQGALSSVVFLSGKESWAPRPGWSDWSYMITYFLNGTPYWIYYGKDQAKDWLTLSVMGLTLLALLRTYMLNKGFERLVFLIFSGLGMMLMYFLLSQVRSCWLDRYLMPASVGFLAMVVAVVFSYPVLFRLGLLAGLGLIFTEGSHPYSYPNLGIDRLVTRIQELNPHRRYAMFIHPDYMLLPVLYHYDMRLFRESARNTLEPVQKMKLLSEEVGIWATDDYDGRRPCWFESADTVLVIARGQDSPFVKALEKDFVITGPPIYVAPHLPIILWAYKKSQYRKN